MHHKCTFQGSWMGQQKDKIVFVLKLKWLVIKSTYRIISVFVEHRSVMTD